MFPKSSQENFKEMLWAYFFGRARLVSGMTLCGLVKGDSMPERLRHKQLWLDVSDSHRRSGASQSLQQSLFVPAKLLRKYKQILGMYFSSRARLVWDTCKPCGPRSEGRAAESATDTNDFGVMFRIITEY